MLNTPRIAAAARRTAADARTLLGRKTAIAYLGTAGAIAAGTGAGVAAAATPAAAPAQLPAAATAAAAAPAAATTTALTTSNSPVPSLPQTAATAAAAQAHHATAIPRTHAAAAGTTAVPVTAHAAQAQQSYAYTGDSRTDLVTVARYLVHEAGYSPAAAAGVAGCVAGESAGSPEATQGYAAGGAGLIQWTPEVSIGNYGATWGGNPHTDFSSQLGAIVRYNQANGDVAALNAVSDPVAASDYYSQHFERPAVIDSDVRPSAALDVYAALTSH